MVGCAEAVRDSERRREEESDDDELTNEEDHSSMYIEARGGPENNKN